MPSKPRNIYIVTGKVHGGKTTFVSRLTTRLSEEGFRVSGFLSPGIFQNRQRTNYTLVSLDNDLKAPLASDGEIEGWFAFRRFFFNPEAFTLGERLIRTGITKGADVVVLDEVGPMELEGGGWSPAIDELQRHPGTLQIWVVRDSVLEHVMERWNIYPRIVIRVSEGEPGSIEELEEQFMEAIITEKIDKEKRTT